MNHDEMTHDSMMTLGSNIDAACALIHLMSKTLAESLRESAANDWADTMGRNVEQLAGLQAANLRLAFDQAWKLTAKPTTDQTIQEVLETLDPPSRSCSGPDPNPEPLSPS
ncbi:MAG TPA: hypothetical protein P5186_19950 [Candidatus Paceibacterota bacterium]|nr:hypothetical protein [Verrucomicrobiota bacterium]HRY50333.1 hypothetical protein [Candidatus Paceibacterota bacterium]